MKKTLLTLLLCCIAIAMQGQVKIGNNPQNIDPASVLELESTDKVLVITRVTTVQMNAITPLQGAMVYNTDVQAVHYFNGTQWINIGNGGGGTGPLTADPIVNDVSTIVITPTGTGNNLEVAPNSITTEQIQDGGINGVDIQDGSIGPGKIQDQSVTQSKLSENSVGAFALDNDNIGLQDFSNAVTQFISSADIISGDPGNAIQAGTDQGAFYDDSLLMSDIQDNTDLINNHITADLDTSPGNEIQNLTLVGNQLTISGANTVTLPAGAAEVDGSITNELQDLSFNAATNILSLSNPATPAGGTVDLSSLAGGGGADGSETKINNSATITVTGNGTIATPYILTAIGGGGGGTTEVIDGTTLTGLGTPLDPFKIEPGTAGQFLTTGPTGVAWTTVTPGGGGTTEVADQITIDGDGQVATPFKVADGGIGNAQLADNAVTTAKILDANVTPVKIEPGTAGQFLTTGPTGVAWTTVTPGGGGTTEVADQTTIDGDGQVATPFKVADGGIGTAQLADNAVTTAKILDANVTNAKIAPGAANQILRTSTDGLNVDWVDLPTGSAVLTDVTLTGDGSSVATALGLADNAVTTAKINNATILLEDIAPNGATADGEIMQWNTTLNAGAGGWEVAPNEEHTGAPKSLFFAGADGLPRQFFHPVNGGASLYWDYEGRTVSGTSYGTLAIGIDGGVLSNDVKVHIAEQLNDPPGAISYGLMLQNRTLNIGRGVGMIFSVDNFSTTYGKGALVFERTGAWASGDFHFLQNQAPNTSNPTLADKAFTVTKEKNIRLYGGIDINGIGLGTAGQVLSTTGTGLQWVNNGGGGGLTLSTDTPNSITTGTDGGILYADGDADATNEIELPAGGANGSILSTDGSGGYSWIANGSGLALSTDTPNSITLGTDGGILYDATGLSTATDANTAALLLKEDVANKSNDTNLGTSATQYPTQNAVKTYVDTQIASVSGAGNLATTNLTQVGGDRTYNLAGQNLFFNGSGNIGIGTINPQNKLHVAGEIRSEGFNSTFGTVDAPAYSFVTSSASDSDTGLYRPAADQIGFSVGGFEGIRISEPSTGNTKVLINQNLELDGTLTDASGSNGTTGQILSSTGAGVDWIDAAPEIFRGKNTSAGPGGLYTVNIPDQGGTNYVINATPIQTLLGQALTLVVTDQQATSFTVQIFEITPGAVTAVSSAEFFWTVIKN